MKPKCPYYAFDQKAKDEHDAWLAGVPKALLDEWDALALEWESGHQAETPDSLPFEECMVFCKHLYSGKTYPGEHITGCAAPENRRIFETTFHPEEII